MKSLLREELAGPCLKNIRRLGVAAFFKQGQDKAPFEVGIEPTNDGCKPPALTVLAIRFLLSVPLDKARFYSAGASLAKQRVWSLTTCSGLLYALFML